MKHIDIKLHFLRSYIKDKALEIKYCCTKDMLADIMTKALRRPRFLDLRGMLYVRNENGVESVSTREGVEVNKC